MNLSYSFPGKIGSKREEIVWGSSGGYLCYLELKFETFNFTLNSNLAVRNCLRFKFPGNNISKIIFTFATNM